MFKMMRNRKGFTLIELMVVVVILGLLAGLAVQQLGGQSDKAKLAKIKADLRTIQSAAELHKLETNGTTYADVNALVTAGYLKKAPTSPVSGYSYSVVSSDGEVKLSDSSGIYSLLSFSCSTDNL